MEYIDRRKSYENGTTYTGTCESCKLTTVVQYLSPQIVHLLLYQKVTMLFAVFDFGRLKYGVVRRPSVLVL